MYSWQLKKFEESVMRDIEESKNYLRFENILLKKNNIKNIEAGDCIYLGNSMPKLFLEKNKKIYSELILYSENDYLKGIVSKFSKTYNEKTVFKKSKAIIESRISPLRFELNESVKLAECIFDTIYLYTSDKLFAKSSLKIGKNGYIFKIEELFDE